MFKIFLYTILLTPLPFGAYRPWAWSLCALLLALGGLVASLFLLFKKSTSNLTLRPLSYSFFLVCVPIAWGLFQLSDLSPGSWDHPFWQLAAEQLPIPVQGHISLAPQETATALMRLLSYFLVFFFSVQFNRDSHNAALTFDSLAYAGLVYAVYGLVIYLCKFNTLLWFDVDTPWDSVRSTFVNRNSYATYAGLTLLAGLPLIFEKIQSSFKYGLKNSFGRQYFLEQVLVRGWFALFLMITIATALCLTESRGGFASTVLAVLAFFIILLLSRKIKNNAAIFFLLATISLISWGVLERSGDKLIERINEITPETEGRLVVYELVKKAIDENSWLGIGYGAFEKGFRLYRDETIGDFYDKAHNTYLENIFELGLLQASALFVAILLMALFCVRGVWLRQRNWIYPAVGFSASLLVGAHALVDFSLQIPAVAYTYALMIGAGVAQALPTRKMSKPAE